MDHSIAGRHEDEIDELVQAGRIEEAIEACKINADYWDEEETDCDQAGDYADGMRASRQASEFRARAHELRQLLLDRSAAPPEA